MAFLRKRVSFRRIPEDRIAAWKNVATASASDMMNRHGSMHPDIKAVTTAARIVGQARTVQCTMADNSILHYISSTAEPGEVIVGDSGGITDHALWGGITTLESYRRGVAGLVLDGSVRDLRESRDIGFPIFCRGITPRGPHKAFGGALDVPIACGGQPVHPGDLILADEDGVVVVPLERENELFQKVINFRRDEQAWFKVLDTPKPFYQVLNIPEPDWMD